MMPTPTRTLGAEASHRPAVGYRCDGAAIRDQASLIEAHIPGLRRFACALLRCDRQGADDLVQDCLDARSPAGTSAERKTMCAAGYTRSSTTDSGVRSIARDGTAFPTHCRRSPRLSNAELRRVK